jgi:RecB family endonuclease NucS
LVASLARSQAETNRIVRQVTKQVGEIGNEFGRFTEGMAEPSMRKLLGERFGMTAIHPRALFRSEDKSRTLEVDVLGYDTNDRRDEVYIVEVKSLFTPEGITQTLKTIADFRELGPVALRHRPIYGVVAAVDIPQGMDQAVASRGLYLARINDDTFQLLTPPGFKPKLFVHETSKGKSNGRANGRSKKKKSRK